jgi:hypothetical protein
VVGDVFVVEEPPQEVMPKVKARRGTNRTCCFERVKENIYVCRAC